MLFVLNVVSILILRSKQKNPVGKQFGRWFGDSIKRVADNYKLMLLEF